MDRLVLTIHGATCDLTDYAALHPGGKEILRGTKDATADFERFGHSDHARTILATLSAGAIVVPAASATVISKLVTHEDYMHVHKTLGLVSALHLLPRVGMAVVCGTDVFARLVHPVWRTLLVAMQVALSLTSMQFVLPRASSHSKPMIHQMFRAHSIVFATRGAVCALLLMWCGYSSCLRALVVLLTMCAADWVTRALTVPGDKYTTTRAMPYWPGISQFRQKRHKGFYASAQLGATLLCLVADTELLPLSTLVAIQGAALLQTLVRKAVISTHTYHMVYTAQLLLPTVLVVATQSLQSAAVLWACASVLLMLRIRFCMDKYLMWMSMGLGTVIWEHGWSSAW